MNEAAATLRERLIKFGVVKTVLVVAATALLVTGGLYVNDQRPFASDEWKALRDADHKGWRLTSMAHSLVDQGLLIGKTQPEVEALIGKRNKGDRGRFVHGEEWAVGENWLMANYYYLHLDFDSGGRVSKATVRETGW